MSSKDSGPLSSPETPFAKLSNTQSAASTSTSSFLDPSAALDMTSGSNSSSEDVKSGEKSGSGSGWKSPRKFGSRILSRQSSRASLKSLGGSTPRTPGGGTTPSASAPANSAAGYFATQQSSSAKGPDADMDKVSTPVPAAPAWRGIPGHVGNLTDAQEARLIEFAQALDSQNLLQPFPTSEDVIEVDRLSVPSESAVGDGGKETDTATDVVSIQRIHLLRWLRARNWDIPAATEMYAKAHAWKFDPSGLNLEGKLQDGWVFEKEEEVARSGWRMYFHKTDKMGRPIFVQDLSNIDATAIFNLVQPEDIIEKFAVVLEEAMRYRYMHSSLAASRTIEDNFMILNVDGLGLSTFWAMKGKLQQLLGILDNNFPELSGRVQIINAPWVFATIFSYIKGWLPQATREKVDIRGADYLPTLLEFIDRESLPTTMQGSCSDCADVGGCDRSDKGPWPKSFGDFVRERERNQGGSSGVKVSIPTSQTDPELAKEEAALKAAVEVKLSAAV